jgi:uncharacterized iron-regulated protein
VEVKQRPGYPAAVHRIIIAVLFFSGCSGAAPGQSTQSTLARNPAPTTVAPRAAPDQHAGKETWLSSLSVEHPLVGTIWKVDKSQPASRAMKKIDRAALAERVRKARFVLLGEKHDNPDHHRLQAEVIAMIAGAGRKPVVAFEMIDPSLQARVDEQLAAAPGDVDGLGKAIAWDQSGWPAWEIYRPVFAAALHSGLPVAAANLPRGEAMDLARGKTELPAAFIAKYRLDAPLPEALHKDLVAELHDSHCGHMPESMIAPMVTIQRARDARMAESLSERATTDGAVLIAGSGHIRADRGVPWYLIQSSGQSANEILTIAFLEVDDALAAPDDYARRHGSGLPFDYVWFTPRVNDIDHCKELEERMKKKTATE